jgi:hypothetical protein
MNIDDLQIKYRIYKKNPTSLFKKKNLSFDEWKIKHNYVEEQPTFVERSNWNKRNLLTTGDYFIKGSNQILSGIGLQIFATGFALITSDSYSNKLKNVNSNDIDEINLITNQQKACDIGACVVGLIGLGFEISGFLNYKKAGIILNENGIGINVKFK